MGCLRAVLVLTGRVYAVPAVHLTANLGFITQEAEVPREAGLSTAFHTPGAPPRPSALKFCAGTGRFAQLEDSPSLMLRAAPFSVAFFLRQRQIPSVASSFFYTLFSLEGVSRLLGCSQLYLQVPRLSKEESCSLEVKSTKAFSSQDAALLTPCILFLHSER